jgi:hypothetical protein
LQAGSTTAARAGRTNLFVLLAQARVEAAAGRLAKARELAEAARERAEKARAPASTLEARLVLGEIDLKEHPGDGAGRKRLQELAREAKAKGYLLIARKGERAVSFRR